MYLTPKQVSVESLESELDSLDFVSQLAAIVVCKPVSIALQERTSYSPSGKSLASFPNGISICERVNLPMLSVFKGNSLRLQFLRFP